MKVIQTIQAPDNEPVDITYYRGDDRAAAIAAVASLVATGDTRYYKTTSIRVEF